MKIHAHARTTVKTRAALVDEVLRQRGAPPEENESRDGTGLWNEPEVVRYEWPRPGDLLHIDIKKLGKFREVGHRITGKPTDRSRGMGWEFVYVCVDDASRMSYVEVLENEQATTAVGFLERARAWFRRRGVRARRVMTDNGSAFVSKLWKARCRKHRARHLRTRPYTPRTNGKAERFIQTLQREWAYGKPYKTSAGRRRAHCPPGCGTTTTTAPTERSE